MRKRKRDSFSPTYCRAYLATLGLFLAAIGALLWVGGVAEGLTWAIAVGVAMAFIGLALIATGLLGASRRVQRWADAASNHEISLVFMALAYPAYLLLRPFYDRR